MIVYEKTTNGERMSEFKIVHQKPKVYNSKRGATATVQPLTKIAIYKEGMPIVLIPDHFNTEIAEGIANSIIAAWAKAHIKPIIKV